MNDENILYNLEEQKSIVYNPRCLSCGQIGDVNCMVVLGFAWYCKDKCIEEIILKYKQDNT
jgi:hypothetical protein